MKDNQLIVISNETKNKKESIMNKGLNFAKRIIGKGWELAKKASARLKNHIVNWGKNYLIGIGSALAGGAITSSLTTAPFVGYGIAALISLMWHLLKYRKIDLNALFEATKSGLISFFAPFVLLALLYLIMYGAFYMFKYSVLTWGNIYLLFLL